MNKISIGLLIAVATVSSCKFPNGGSFGGGGGGGTVPSMSTINKYLDDATMAEMGKCPTLSVDNYLLQRKLPIVAAGSKGGWKNPEYTNHIAEQFDKPYMKPLKTQPIKSADLDLIGCPGYNNATEDEKKKFWVLWMSSISYAESANNTYDKYREADGTISSGLLQIDYASANRWCSDLAPEFNKTKFDHSDMFDPKINLQCGMMMMQRQILGVPMLKNGRLTQNRPELEGSLFTGKAWYWSVLRNNSGKQKVIGWFKNHAERQLGFCKGTNIDIDTGDIKLKYQNEAKLTSRAHFEDCSKITDETNRNICIESQKIQQQEEGETTTVGGPGSQTGEQLPQTQDESCDIVNDTSRTPKPEEVKNPDAQDSKDTPETNKTINK